MSRYDERDIPAFNEETDFEVPLSKENPVPGWLKMSYVVLPIFGLFLWVYYINGSHGWLDRGYWQQLQIAANTTFPQINQDMPPENQKPIEKD